MRKIRNVLAAIGGATIALLFLLFITGQLNHLFYPWQGGPQVLKKVFPSVGGGNIELIVDRQWPELRTIRLPCDDNPDRNEVRDTLKGSTKEGILTCKGENLEESRSWWRWDWLFLGVPEKKTPAPTQPPTQPNNLPTQMT